MELNKTLLKAYINKEDKEGLDNIIIITDNKGLQTNLMADICTLYFENDINFIGELKNLLQENLEQLKDIVFLPLMKKDNNNTFALEFNSTFLNIKIDVDAWRLKKGKSDTYYLQNDNELIKNITDFAVNRGYYITGIKELDQKEQRTSMNFDNMVILTDNLGTKKSLENIGFNPKLSNNNFDNFKNKKVIIVNSEKETAEQLLKYCFSLKVINTIITSEEEFVNLIIKSKEKLPNWVKVNDKGSYKLNQDLLAQQYINNKNLIQVLNMDKLDTYIYENGVYKLVTKDFIKKDLSSYIPNGLANNMFISDAVNMVSNRAPLIKFEELNADEKIINFKNGIYNIDEDKLYPHSPDIYSTIQLNCNFNREAKGDKWKIYMVDLCTDTLTGNVDTEKINHLQLWGGLTISNIPMYKPKACLCLFSKNGDTGKSVFLNVLIALLGADNTSTIPIQDLSKSFALSGVYGKRANIVGDQKATALQDSSIFKQFTGGDLLDIEFKGKTRFSFRHNGGLLFACNTLPYITDDKGTHIYDRLHIIPFNNVIPEKDRKPNLINELKEELEYIAIWYLRGLKQFIKNGYKIPRCTASNQAVENFRENNDHLYSFLINNYEITRNPKDRIVKIELEEHYLKWCEEEEIPEKAIISKRGFKNIMLDSYNVGTMQANDGKRYYKGLKYKIIDNAEQGEEIEQEAKEIFSQQKL